MNRNPEAATPGTEGGSEATSNQSQTNNRPAAQGTPSAQVGTSRRLSGWLVTGIFASGILVGLVAAAIVAISALSGRRLWNVESVIISVVVFTGLLGIYPLAYLAYLGLRGESERERLIDDFGLLGLEDKDKIEQTVKNLYRTVFNPVQYSVFILLILLFSVIVVLAFFHRDRLAFVDARAVELAFFAYLGAYVFSVQELIRRFNTKDLLPQVYSSILGRMILAVTITFVGAVIIELSVSDLAEGSTNAESVIPAWSALLAFVIGVFPRRGMSWFSQRTENVLQTAGRAQDERPLEHIIGISPLHAARLTEMGIDDAQNLATADLRRLLLTTQFDTQQVVNWVDQAILYVKVGDLVDRFRDAKIGTFHELNTLVADLDLFPTLAATQPDKTEAGSIMQQLLPVLGLGSTDQLRRLAIYGNYPNYAHIAEYYYRKGKVARERAKLGMERILGAQAILLVGTIDPADPRVIHEAEKIEYERNIRDLKRVLPHDPANTEQQIHLAILYYFLSEYERAKETLLRALDYDSELAEAYYILGAIYLAEEDYGTSIRECTNALRIDPNQAKAHANRGLAYIKENYVDLALQDLNRAIALDDHLPVAYLYRGIVHNMMSNWELAVSDFETTYLLDHQVDLLWLAWGNALIGLEQYDQAIDKLTLAVQGDKDVPSAFAKRAWIYILKGKAFYPQAQRDLDAAIKIAPDSPDVYGNLGLLERAKGNNQEAIDNYQKALALDESLYVIRYNLAKVTMFLGELEDARREYKRVLQDIPADSKDSMRRDVNRDLGFIEYRLGEYEGAVAHFDHTLSADEADQQARYYQSLAYFRLGKLNRARVGFKQIVDSSMLEKDDPLLIDTYENLGLIALASDEYQSAVSYFLAALEVDPDNLTVRYNLGVTYVELNKLKAAEEEFGTIVRNRSSNGALIDDAQEYLSQLKKIGDPKDEPTGPVSEPPDEGGPGD